MSGLVRGMSIMGRPCLYCGEKTWCNVESRVEICNMCGFMYQRGRDGNLTEYRERGEKWKVVPDGCLFVFVEEAS